MAVQITEAMIEKAPFGSSYEGLSTRMLGTYVGKDAEWHLIAVRADQRRHKEALPGRWDWVPEPEVFT